MAPIPGPRLTRVGLAELPPRHPAGVFHAFWRGVAEDSTNAAPWASFDPADHPKILPWILLLKREGVAAGREAIWRYSLCGTGCIDLFGSSFQGKVLGEDLPPDLAAQRRAEFDRVSNGAGPSFSRAELPIPGRSLVRIYRGVFPFTDSGPGVERVVVILAEADFEIG